MGPGENQRLEASTPGFGAGSAMYLVWPQSPPPDGAMGKEFRPDPALMLRAQQLVGSNLTGQAMDVLPHFVHLSHGGTAPQGCVSTEGVNAGEGHRLALGTRRSLSALLLGLLLPPWPSDADKGKQGPSKSTVQSHPSDKLGGTCHLPVRDERHEAWRGP